MIDVDLTNFQNKLDISVLVDFENLTMGAGMYLSNDNLYWNYLGSYYFGYYFQPTTGYVGLKLKELKIILGKSYLKDAIESPYSLFISSEPKTPLSATIEYENSHFFYKSLWIGLTKQIRVEKPILYDFPDRGANYKCYGIKIGALRIGFQEVAVYTGRFFDLEYFASPVPNFFIQYANYSGRPFKQGTNDNSMMGFFFDYFFHETYAYAQILIDDMNMNRFLYPESFQNPDKIAWSLGGYLKTSFGKIYAYHAGATKYTFEPFSHDNPYGYVYFPQTIAPLGNATRVVFPEENYIGFKYGENTLAFMVGWQGEFSEMKTEIGAEYVLSGSKSYNNPWHELKNFPPGTHLLDENPIEKNFRIFLNVEKTLGFMTLFGKLNLHWISNKLEPIQGSDGEGYILVPGDENLFNISIILGISANLKLWK